MLDVLHHVVRRIGIPAHVEQLHHVAIGREEGQLLDFARQQRPVQAAAMRVELDRHLPAGVVIDRHPHFAERAGPQEPLGLIAGHVVSADATA